MLNSSRTVLLALVLVASQSFAWPGNGGGRDGRGDRGRSRGLACFYEHANFTGASFCLRSGERYRNLDGFFNDMISSVSIDGNVQVMVYKDARFSGGSMSISRDAANLSNSDSLLDKWNDKISSVEVY